MCKDQATSPPSLVSGLWQQPNTDAQDGRKSKCTLATQLLGALLLFLWSSVRRFQVKARPQIKKQNQENLQTNKKRIFTTTRLNRAPGLTQYPAPELLQVLEALH